MDPNLLRGLMVEIPHPVILLRAAATPVMDSDGPGPPPRDEGARRPRRDFRRRAAEEQLDQGTESSDGRRDEAESVLHCGPDR